LWVKFQLNFVLLSGSAIRSKLKSRVRGGRGRVSIRFPGELSALERGLCCSERRPLFRGVAREKA
jgi:hypothetical protein